MDKIAELLRTNSNKTTDRNTSFLLPAEDTFRRRTSFSDAHQREALMSYQQSHYTSLQHFHKENQGNPQTNTNTLTHEVMIHQFLPLQTC